MNLYETHNHKNRMGKVKKTLYTPAIFGIKRFNNIEKSIMMLDPQKQFFAQYSWKDGIPAFLPINRAGLRALLLGSEFHGTIYVDADGDFFAELCNGAHFNLFREILPGTNSDDVSKMSATFQNDFPTYKVWMNKHTLPIGNAILENIERLEGGSNERAGN